MLRALRQLDRAVIADDHYWIEKSHEVLREVLDAMETQSGDRRHQGTVRRRVVSGKQKEKSDV